MATNESSYQAAGMVGKFLVGLSALLVILGIGYVNVWPKVVATYYGSGATTTNVQPTTAAVDTTEIDRLKAQNAAIQAQINAMQSRTIVQEVPPGDVPNTIKVNDPPAPPPDTNNPPAEPPAPAPRIVINHVTSADGAHQTITGSGACAVAAKAARRCGDK